MKVSVERGKYIKGNNPNKSRKQRRYKSHGLQGTKRASLAEQLRAVKSLECAHSHHERCCCGQRKEEENVDRN